MKTTIIILATILTLSCEKQQEKPTSKEKVNYIEVFKAVDPDVYQGEMSVKFAITGCEIKSNVKYHELIFTGEKCYVYIKLKNSCSLSKNGIQSYISENYDDSLFCQVTEYILRYDDDGIEHKDLYYYDFAYGTIDFYNSKYYINFEFYGFSKAVLNYVK